MYDRLVSDEILAEISDDAARIYVGKQGGTHSIPQEEINALLIDLASKYHCVVRLKGGDPYVFGRGAEEAMALVAAGVEFQVVPGITAATGIMAGIGLPLTHRGVANGVRFVTAQCGKNVPLELNWDSLADPDTTLVVYMGLAKLPEISEKLIAAGMPAEQLEYVPAMVRKRAIEKLHAQGIARHSRDEVNELGIRDVLAFSELLGTESFLFGEQPTSFDACAYGVIGNIKDGPFAGPVRDKINNTANIAAYIDRIRKQYFSDLDEGSAD